jgi:hypothetical protein
MENYNEILKDDLNKKVEFISQYSNHKVKATIKKNNKVDLVINGEELNNMKLFDASVSLNMMMAQSLNNYLKSVRGSQGNRMFGYVLGE